MTPEEKIAELADSLRFYCDLSLRLADALEEIADADYRGNRSQEAEIAHRALVAEGLRSDPVAR